MTDHARPTCSPDQGCAICGDVAVPARVTATDAATGMATAEPLEAAGAGAGAPVAVALDLVDGVRVGDIVLVHQGFAIERLAARP